MLSECLVLVAPIAGILIDNTHSVEIRKATSTIDIIWKETLTDSCIFFLTGSDALWDMKQLESVCPARPKYKKQSR